MRNMKIVWLCVVLLPNVYANAASSCVHSIQCTDEYNSIDCTTTITKHNRNANATTPNYPSRNITLECIACDLETFPAEIFNCIVFKFANMDFSNSHITDLKMNDLNLSATNKILSLRFRNNSITRLDDESLPTSETINELDFSHNRIEHVCGKRTFMKMQNLRDINLGYNHIAQLDPLIFQNMRLRELDLTSNMMSDPSFIVNLRNTTEALTLSNNPIATLEKTMFVLALIVCNSTITHCTIGRNLKQLELDDGILGSIDLSDATDLMALNLSSNQLTHFEYANPRSLRHLLLSSNRLQTIRIGHAKLLFTLDLSRNNITSTLGMSLPVALEHLNLSHNKITNLEPKLFAHLKNLTHLILIDCQLLNADFILPTSLEFLDLSHNKFVYLDLNIFNGLNRLQVLDLSGNRLSDLIVNDMKNKIWLEISNNYWNCSRLNGIVDELKRRNVDLGYGPCNQLTCKEHIHGIACDDHITEILTPHNVQAICYDLNNVLIDIQRLRDLKTSENHTQLENDAQNSLNHNVTNSIRDISDRFERIREITSGFLTEINNKTAERRNRTYSGAEFVKQIDATGALMTNASSGRDVAVFTADEIVSITKEVFVAMAKCRNKEEQLGVIMKLSVKYIYGSELP